jgi:predicted Zn-dependent protease
VDAENPFLLEDYQLSRTMTEAVDSLFDQGIERYKAGESFDTLIPVFKEVCDRAPKSSSAWTCLAWLYALADKPVKALDAAQKAVKLNPQDAQARVNLAIAMLDAGKKGVRQHVDIAAQIMMVIPEVKAEVEHNLEDGIARKPDWQSLERVRSWLLE